MESNLGKDMILGLGIGFLFVCMVLVIWLFGLALTQGIVTGDFRVVVDINAYGEAFWELGLILVMGTCAVSTTRYVLSKVWGRDTWS